MKRVSTIASFGAGDSATWSILRLVPLEYVSQQLDERLDDEVDGDPRK